MHEFHFRSGQLYCEDVPVRQMARRYGTPCYLYSYQTLVDHCRKLQRAFAELDPMICFSVKSNGNLAVLRSLVNEGAGLDIVSGGELHRAKLAGVAPHKVVYASVGKTEEEIAEGIRFGILFFNVESEPELARINAVARRLRRVASVALRLRPDVQPKTHRYITTGHKISKFGIDVTIALKMFRQRNRYPHVAIRGIHVHIGSQITEASPYTAAIRRVMRFVDQVDPERWHIQYLNIGGGLGIVYKDETPQTAEQFARAVLPILRKARLRLILEPGRFIAGNAGILVTRVLYIKETTQKRFVIVDAGMNDLIRPSLYGAYHEIVPVVQRSAVSGQRSAISGQRSGRLCDVVGPICETGDFLGQDRRLAGVRSGDYLAVMGAGAYGFTMASNYNARPRAPELLVLRGKVHVVRARETRSDLTRSERIPPALKVR